MWFRRFLYLNTGDIIDQRDTPDNKNVSGTPAHVEVIARDQQDYFPRRASRHKKQHPHEHKEEEELEAIEEHGRFPSRAGLELDETTPLYRPSRLPCSGGSDRKRAGWDRE